MTVTPRGRPSEPTTAEQVWLEHRGRAFALAYRMTGSVSDAEDVLQEAYLRLRRVDVGELLEPGAWLTRVVGRLCLDQLTSARARREVYPGPWLPEPLLEAAEPDVAGSVVLAESLSAAFLVLLETLSPAQRVAFVMRDVFGLGYDELARTLARSEVACRHLVARARDAVKVGRPRYEEDGVRRKAVAEAFQAACTGGGVQELFDLLAPDVVVRADGGGLVSSARRPVLGADRSARFLAGVLAKATARPEPLAAVNGVPGVGGRDEEGRLRWVMAIGVADDGTIATVDIVTNPEKLRHLSPTVADLPRSDRTARPTTPSTSTTGVRP